MSNEYQQHMVNVLKFHTPKFLRKWHMQTVKTQIRLQSDQGLHCLPVHKEFQEISAKAKFRQKKYGIRCSKF